MLTELRMFMATSSYASGTLLMFRRNDKLFIVSCLKVISASKMM